MKKKGVPVYFFIITHALGFLTLLFFLGGELPAKSPKTAKVIKAEAATKIICEYNFVLSPAKEDKPDEYSRLEIENFLCAMAENYISAEILTRYNSSSNYYISNKESLPLQKPRIEQGEILKWFEDRVTVTVRGQASPLNQTIIRKFYQRINQLLGREQFVFLPELPVANIVIELKEGHVERDGHHYLGETSLLHDNLRTRLGLRETEVYLDIYTMGDSPLIIDSRQITFTPEEMAFREENRLVKVFLTVDDEPRIGYFSLVHELLHTLGFCGHSPYLESLLFPFPVDAFIGPLPQLEHEELRLTPLAERMVEMLYRPEILPGMSLEQAAHVLSSLKLRHLTPEQDTATFLTSLTQELQATKKKLITQGKEYFDRNLDIMLIQDRLNMKELALLAELQEIKLDYKMSDRIIEEIKNAPTPLAKMVLLRREMIVHLYHKNILTAQLEAVKGNQQVPLRRQLKIHQIQIVVLDDLIALQKDIDAAEEKLQAAKKNQNLWQLEASLRRIERQLVSLGISIKKK